VGYRGTRNFVYEVGNLLIDQIAHHGRDDWPLPATSRSAAAAPLDIAQAPPFDHLAAASA
jgi:nitrogenase molybdenum-iron protein NifN